MTMAKRGIPRVHPGEHLGEEIKELGLTANAFAEAIGVPSNRIYQLINGKRNMTANTALRLAAFFGTSAQMWMNLQANYDLWHEERAERRAIKKIKPFKRAA